MPSRSMPADLSAAELGLRLRQQELVASFGCFALETDDLQAILDEASRVAALGLETSFAKVLQCLADEKAFLVRSGVGWKPGVVGHARVGNDVQSPAGYAFRTGEPVLSNDLASEPRFRTPKLLADHGIRSAINVLVRTNGRRGVRRARGRQHQLRRVQYFRSRLPADPCQYVRRRDPCPAARGHQGADAARQGGAAARERAPVARQGPAG